MRPDFREDPMYDANYHPVCRSRSPERLESRTFSSSAIWRKMSKSFATDISTAISGLTLTWLKYLMQFEAARSVMLATSLRFLIPLLSTEITTLCPMTSIHISQPKTWLTSHSRTVRSG